MKRIANDVVFLLFTYPAGLLIGVVFEGLCACGLLEVKGSENFPRQKGRILVVSNHPYKGEQFLLTALFFVQYLLHPFKYGPYTMADLRNYYNSWLWWFLRPRLIPVDRTKRDGDPQSLWVARRIIESGANIITFPEGGRTGKGPARLVSRRGKEIRPLKGGFSFLATGAGVVTVLVWVEFSSWRSMKLTIGEPVKFEGMAREEVVQRTQEMLLELADAS